MGQQTAHRFHPLTRLTFRAGSKWTPYRLNSSIPAQVALDGAIGLDHASRLAIALVTTIDHRRIGRGEFELG
jgi:hypothetical protein